MVSELSEVAAENARRLTATVTAYGFMGEVTFGEIRSVRIDLDDVAALYDARGCGCWSGARPGERAGRQRQRSQTERQRIDHDGLSSSNERMKIENGTAAACWCTVNKSG